MNNLRPLPLRAPHQPFSWRFSLNRVVHDARRLLLTILFMGFASMASATDFVVTSSADDGVTGTLRWAIFFANLDAAGAPHTISFGPGLAGSTIKLTSDLTGLINPTSVNILKPTSLTIDGSNLYQLFAVDGAVAVSLGGVSLINGKAGAGVLVNGGGRLTLDAVTFSGKGNITGKGVVEKVGASTIVLNQANTYSGGTVISDGVVQLADPSALGDGPIQNFATLEFAAGLSANSASYTQTPTGTFVSTAGAGCATNTLNVTNGSVLLAGKLNFSLGSGCAPALGAALNLITVASQVATQGAFNGLLQGAEFAQAGYKFKINYQGGNGNDVTLTVTGVPIIPQSITFPSIGTIKKVGDTAVLGATASSNLPVTYIDTPGVCTVSGTNASFIGTGICTITATQSGNGTYSAATPVAQTITVTAPALSLTPTPLDFGSQEIDIVATKTVTVTNTGTADLLVTAPPAIQPANSDYAPAGNTCTAAVTPGNTCTISVTFKPTASGSRTARLVISTNASAAASSVQLTGVGTLIPQTITINPVSARIVGDTAALSASSTSGLTNFTFGAGPAGVCSLSAPTAVKLDGLGTCTVTASLPASGKYSSATATLPFAVDQIRPSFTSANTTSFTYGTPGSFTVKASGTPPPALSLTVGTVPTGLKFDPATGILSGTPTPAQSSTVPLTFTATNAAGKVDQPFSLVIAKAEQVIQINQNNPLPAKTFGDAPFVVSISGGGSANPVVLTSTTPDVCSVNDATKEVSIIAASPPSCTLKATQAGDNKNYNPAPDVTKSFEIKQKSQAITFTAPGSKTFIEPFQTFDLIATSDGPVTIPIVFTSTTPGICTLAGIKATITGAGSCTITAEKAGDRNYLAALKATQTFIVQKAIQAIDFKQIIVTTFTPDPIPISATSSNPITPLPNTPIVFTSATPSICTVNNVASTVSLLAAGDCTIKANQAGDANYLAAAEVSRTFNPIKAQQAITFADIPLKTFGDGPFVISATGGPSGLPVLLSSTTPTICTLSGSTVTIVNAGPCTIAATQAGNDKYSQADSSKTVTIAQQKQVITFGPLAVKTFGDAPFDIGATGGASGNAVTFSSTTPAVCTLSDKTVSIAGAGTCNIEASQTGNANYAAAVPVPQSFIVAKAAQSITFDELPAKTYGDGKFKISATTSAGLPVSIASLTGATCEVVQNEVTITAAGTCTLRASQGGDNNYEKAPDVDRSFNVISNSTIGFSPLPNQPKSGEPITLVVTVKPQGAGAAPTGTVTFSDNGAQIGAPVPLVNGVATFTTSALANGNHKITASYSGDANNKAGTSDVFGVTVLVQTTVTGGGGSSGGSGGGGGCTMGVKERFDPAMPMLLFAAMIFFIRRNKMNPSRFLPALLLSTLMAGNALAAEPGFFVGLGGGKSSSEGDNYDFNQRLIGQGFNVKTTLKFDDFAWKLFGGYQVNQYLAVEAAYLDLGKVSVTADGVVADPAAFANAVARVQPRLAKGGALSVMGSIPVNPKFFAYAKLGVMRWSAESGASTGSLNTQASKTSGNAALFAIGGEAELTSGWSGRAEVERYQIKPDAANLFTLNLVYRF
jgi:autotransporter-associated beta strand protein